ncbi:MAG: glycosyltransferase family 39 protein, partial [candidate division Zixibacteria bacterium]|nr:glycosyltransferase family 39 protein [candidate division Zixibacteria bacterium]
MTVPRESRQDESPPLVIHQGLLSEIEESRWYWVGLVAAIVIALIVLFREFIFSNKMLFSGDILLHGIFNRSLVADFVRGAGPFPLWNPYVSCGLPFVDAIHGAIFYPLAFLDFLGYLPRMVGFTMLAHFVLAGAATYLAARRLGFSKGAATVASVSYALSPNLLTWVAPGHEGKIYAAALFPLALYCVERLITGGRWRDLAYTGLVIGMLILTPHLQMAYYVILTLAAFSCVRMFTLYRGGLSRGAVLSRLLKVGAAIVLALAVSGIQLIPSARYLLEFSPRADQERGEEYAASYSLHAEEAVALAFPDFCGMDRLYERYLYWGKNNVKDNSEAISIVTWMLAILALVFRDTRLRGFWSGLAIITLLYALGDATPFLRGVTAVLPFFEQMRAPSTAMFLFSFSMAMLAGAAIDSVRQARISWSSQTELRINGVILICLGISASYAIVVFLFPESALRTFAQLFNPQLLSSHEAGGGRWERAITYLPNIQLGAVLSVVFTGTAGLLLWRRLANRMRPLLPIALSFLIILSNFVFVSKFIRTVDPHVLFENNPIARVYARADSTARTQWIRASRIEFQLGYYHIPNTTGFHGKELRWFFSLVGGTAAPEALNPRFANLTGTRYFICPRSTTVPPLSFG